LEQILEQHPQIHKYNQPMVSTKPPHFLFPSSPPLHRKITQIFVPLPLGHHLGLQPIQLLPNCQGGAISSHPSHVGIKRNSNKRMGIYIQEIGINQRDPAFGDKIYTPSNRRALPPPTGQGLPGAFGGTTLGLAPNEKRTGLRKKGTWQSTTRTGLPPTL